MSAETTPPGKANNGQRTPAPEMPENSFMAKEKRPAKKPVSFPLLGRVDSRATHLKQPLGCFKRAGPGRAFSSHPPAAQTKTPCRSTAGGVVGGSGWIRTTEAIMQQIYSLPPLAAREHSHMFPRSIECLSIIARGQKKSKRFFDFFLYFFCPVHRGHCIQKIVTPRAVFCGIMAK